MSRCSYGLLLHYRVRSPWLIGSLVLPRRDSRYALSEWTQPALKRQAVQRPLPAIQVTAYLLKQHEMECWLLKLSLHDARWYRWVR